MLTDGLLQRFGLTKVVFRTSFLRRLGLLALMSLALGLPFELESPSLALGKFRLTNLELMLGMTLLLALVIAYRGRTDRPVLATALPRSWLLLLGLYATALILSALLSPEFRLNALKAAARSLSGVAIAVATPQLVRNRRQMLWVGIAIVAGGMVSAFAGLIEFWDDKPLTWLSLFRERPTVVGPYFRLTGSFNHANQAAMFIEATLPLLLTICWIAYRQGRRILAILLAIAGLLYLETAFLTYSRTSFVAAFVSSLFVALLLWFGSSAKRRQLAVPWIIASAVVALLTVANAAFNPLFRLRLSSQSDNEWYRLSFRVPDRLDMEVDEIAQVTVHVANLGNLVWSSAEQRPVNLAARLLSLSDRSVRRSELRWPLHHDVKPGESIEMTVPIQAPVPPGNYLLEWDMVQEQVVWFSMKNGLNTTTRLNVSGAAADTQTVPGNVSGDMPLPAQPIPNRLTLWRVALQGFLERPLLGIGLDNFRLTYGRVLGESSWNDTIHTNSWYLETLVSLGLLGTLPFFGWLVLFGFDLVRKILGPTVTLWQMSLGVGLLSFMIHGLLDYFLLFNGTGLLFWLLVGLWLVQRQMANQDE